MHFQVLTLYPEIFVSFLSSGLMKKALDEERIRVEIINFRKHGLGKHKKVDASPYGGGAGMVLRPEPIFHTLQECKERTVGDKLHSILISPQGSVFNQEKAKRISKLNLPIALICGRFEGFDERIRGFVDEEFSLGDFILMGGEIGAMAIIESVARLIPGVVGNEESLTCESFSNGLLEYSQYTRPYDFQGFKVPDVLVSGNHQKIEEWRQEDSLKKTKKKRLDLFDRFGKKDQQFE